MAAATHAPLAYAPRLRTSLERLRLGVLWLMLASSSIVLVEPAPYDAMFVFAFFIFAVTGLTFSRRFAPLLFLVILFNIGGAFSLIPFLDQQPSVMFVIVSFYLGFSAVIFANIVTENTVARLDMIRKGWILAGLIASLAGIMGYFGVAGTADLFTRFSRASGTFKDPNVFGPFVAVPAVMIVQGFMSGTLKRPIISLGILLVLMAGIFLSFSRGAWGVTVGASMMTGGLLFVTTTSNATRARIIFITVAGLAFLSLLLAAALSIDAVQRVFEVRASLSQDYDTGARGRFGKILEAIPMLLERPNGFGPLRFTDWFPEAPHNVFVNAFSAYGWLGGVSYFALIVITVWIGWATVWRRTPWQATYIGLWSVTFCQILQGFQIDSDHWRHLWLLIGITWGLAAASNPKPLRRFAGATPGQAAPAPPAPATAAATSRR